MHEPGDKIIVADHGLAVAPGLHTLFDIGYTLVSMRKSSFLAACDLFYLRNCQSCQQLLLTYGSIFIHRVKYLNQTTCQVERPRCRVCQLLAKYKVTVLWLLRSLLSTELDVRVIAQVPLINTLVLSNLCECRHKPNTAKIRFFGLHFCRRHYRCVFNHLD